MNDEEVNLWKQHPCGVRADELVRPMKFPTADELRRAFLVAVRRSNEGQVRPIIMATSKEDTACPIRQSS